MYWSDLALVFPLYLFIDNVEREDAECIVVDDVTARTVLPEQALGNLPIHIKIIKILSCKLFLKHLLLSELGTRSLFQGSLSAHFISMDCYRSSAHFANFQVRSSLNRSKKTSGSLLEKSAKTQNRS